MNFVWRQNWDNFFDDLTIDFRWPVYFWRHKMKWILSEYNKWPLHFTIWQDFLDFQSWLNFWNVAAKIGATCLTRWSIFAIDNRFCRLDLTEFLRWLELSTYRHFSSPFAVGFWLLNFDSASPFFRKNTASSKSAQPFHRAQLLSLLYSLK